MGPSYDMQGDLHLISARANPLKLLDLRTAFACGAFAVRFWARIAFGRPMLLIVSQRYSYLACGPRVACKVCGKTATAQVKESGSATFGGPPAAWSLHCGACRTPLMTTVFERLDNPFFRGLSEKNREQYEKKPQESGAVAIGRMAGDPRAASHQQSNWRRCLDTQAAFSVPKTTVSRTAALYGGGPT